MTLVYTLIATAPFGLEAVVARELQQLGFDDTATVNGGVRFRADADGIARANLWLRSADRVLLLAGEVPASAFDDLFEGVKALPWPDFLPRDAAFPVAGKSKNSILHSVPAVQAVVKKAIAASLERRYGQSWFPETGALFAVEAALDRDIAIITVDTSGPGLHKRGYRQHTGPAPLKETLAAALVLLSRWQEPRPFADPLCGTGTIAIEAALLARRIAPGTRRSFVSESFPWVGLDAFARAREEARDIALPSRDGLVRASDIDPASVRLAQENARLAAVEADISFSAADVRDFQSADDYGCIVTNPPYGERMGTASDAATAHSALGDLARRLPTWSLFVLSAYPESERRIRLRADKRRKLYNGRIECQLYQYLRPLPPRTHSLSKPDASDAAQRPS